MGDRSVPPAPASLVAHVVNSVVGGLRQGTLRSTERLPSERGLAAKLNVSRNTVTAAYGELEQQGIIRRLRGKGAFVCALPVSTDGFSWSGKVSSRANLLDEPVLELLARSCAQNFAFPMSAGTPSLEVFPMDPYQASAGRVMAQQLPSALAVAPTEGQWILREAIAAWTGVAPQHVMITAGAQEAVDLLARCLVEPGDFVVIDSPSYPGAIQSFRSAGARLLPWSTDWSMGQLENLLLRFRPKLIFTMPTLHNPTGRVMSLKKRMRLLELARRYRTPVLEDDVYARTGFGEHLLPESLYKLDRHAQVITMSTFSKILAPGLRIGWLVAPLYMVKQLSLIKMRSNLFTGGLNQFILADMLRTGEMEQHLVRLRQHHCGLCEAAMHALQPAVDEGLVHYSVPAGSLYLWIELLGHAHTHLDADVIFATMESRGLSVAPGIAFEPDRTLRSSSHFRLCFTATSRDAVIKAMHLLTEILREFRSTPQLTAAQRATA